MVRRLKTADTAEVVAALERTQIPAGLGIDIATVRRLVCLKFLDPAEWNPADKSWREEMERADKVLLGVYSAAVRPEAVFAQLICFSKGADWQVRYAQSVREMGWETEVVRAAQSLLKRSDQANGGDSAV